MPGVCDKAEGKVQPVSKDPLEWAPRPFKTSYCASREPSLCFELSLSLKEVGLEAAAWEALRFH
jgi:hypothetical protein